MTGTNTRVQRSMARLGAEAQAEKKVDDATLKDLDQLILTLKTYLVGKDGQITRMFHSLDQAKKVIGKPETKAGFTLPFDRAASSAAIAATHLKRASDQLPALAKKIGQNAPDEPEFDKPPPLPGWEPQVKSDFHRDSTSDSSANRLRKLNVARRAGSQYRAFSKAPTVSTGAATQTRMAPAALAATSTRLNPAAKSKAASPAVAMPRQGGIKGMVKRFLGR